MGRGELKYDGLRCPGCGYELTGLPEQRCPECGRCFDATQLQRAEDTGRQALGWAGFAFTLIASGAMGWLAISAAVIGYANQSRICIAFCSFSGMLHE